MTSRTPRLPLVVLILLALSACSAAVGTTKTLPVTGGTIELAVSETCAKGADPQCVAVNGENVVLPSAFERASVENATVAEAKGQNAVDVTFNKDGAAVFHALTEKAARGGNSARLVMKAGNRLLAAVAVMHALEGDHVQINLSPDDTAQEMADLIHGG